MPQFDDLSIYTKFTFGEDLTMRPPVVIKSKTIDLSNCSPLTAGPDTFNFPVIDLPAKIQPFISIWALIRLSWTAFGDVASLTLSLGTTGAYDDLIQPIVEPGLVTDRIYGLLYTEQGTAHYGTSNQLSGFSVGMDAAPGAGTLWSTDNCVLRIVTNNVGPYTTAPSGSVRVYVMGFTLDT